MRLSGWDGLAAGVVAWSFLVAAEAKAGWHDENLVLLDGHWEAIPDDVWGTPHPPFDDRWTKTNATIVVLISALRESRLVDTIKSAFDQASFPERIRVGVVQQNDPTDPDCIVALCEQRGKPLLPLHEIAQEYEAVPRFSNPLGCEEFDKVRVFRMDASEAAGPVFARAHQESLVEDEDFCMQIDAHTIFSEGWDVAMLGEWGATKNEFAVLTTYPTNYKDIGKNSNKHWEMPHICGVSMSKTGSISNHQAGAIANMDRPMIAPVWAAGLSFSRCHAERRVPNDINLRQVFSGEEYSRGARLWTSGYDFYSITRPIIGVYYGNEKKNKGSWKGNRQEMESSMSRIRTLLNMPGSDQSPEALAKLGRHGLGDRRTLDQYIEFSGIDPQRLVAKDKCVVRYVPWELGGLRDSILAEDRHVLEVFQNSEEEVGEHDAPKKKLRSNHFRKDKLSSSTSKTKDFTPSSSEAPKPFGFELAYKVPAGIVMFIVGVVGLKYILPKRRLLQTKEV